METKPRCEKELHIEKYFGLPADVSPDKMMNVSYSDLVDLLYSWQQQSGSAGVWVRASDRLPEIGQIKFSRIKGHLMSLIQVSINTGKIHFAGVLRPTEYSYSDIEWLDESLPDEKDKEIERLKELIETLYKAKASEGKLESEIEPAWQQFKTDNNL